MLSTYKDGIRALNEEIKTFLTDDINDRHPIYDGALNPEEYFKSPLRIMWLMKEPYDEDGGGWSFPDDIIANDDKLYELVHGNTRSTWQPVVYSMYSVFNDFIEYDAMDYIRNNPKMKDALKKIAWVNISKLPSKNGTVTAMQDIHEAYQKNKPLLYRQIELLNPNIIICGNTFSVIQKEIIPEKQFEYSGEYDIAYGFVNNRLYIDTYHPSRKGEKYINGITSIIKKHFPDIQLAKA